MDTWIKETGSGGALEFVVNGMRAAVLTASGDLLCLGAFEIADHGVIGARTGGEGQPQTNALTFSASDENGTIRVWMRYAGDKDSELYASFEEVLTITPSRVRVRRCAEPLPDGVLRDLYTLTGTSDAVLSGGVYDTAEDVAGPVKVAVGGKSVLEFYRFDSDANAAVVLLRGSVYSNTTL